jgi:hypothetical protein
MAKTTKTVTLSADALNAIVSQLRDQNEKIAGLTALVDTKVPAKAVPAKVAPEIEMTATQGKYGTGLVFNFAGRKSGRFLYPAELKILFGHKTEIEAEIKKLGK